MHIYSLHEVSLMAIRLVKEGMSLKHAVHLVAGSYGFNPDDIFRQVAVLENN